jgi:hypothetical protein
MRLGMVQRDRLYVSNCADLREDSCVEASTERSFEMITKAAIALS